MPRLMCMTRMSLFAEAEAVTVAPMHTFPLIRDLATDVSYNYEKAKTIPPLRLRTPESEGRYGMRQEDVERSQEFHKCIECFLCQDVCHVIRDHDLKNVYAGPRFFIQVASLEMHPLDTGHRLGFVRDEAGIGLCNITKCCTEVCPALIRIRENAIIPLKERWVDEFFDPVRWLFRKVRGRWGSAT